MVSLVLSKNFSADEVSTLWELFTPLSPPSPNKEKIHDIHKKVLQYVPPDLRSDPLYIVPDAADRETEQQAVNAAQHQRLDT
ncbi:hypothetical protein PC128_g9667 [Phytophthora cactorum]|nr:hypothetical protein PC128_g9667 [Phytophthora cactorum]